MRLQAPFMDAVADLIDGLERLAVHYRVQGLLSREPGLQHDLALSLALLRNTVAPAVTALPPLPLHVALVGGTNSGKSTVTNVLVGAAVARWSLQGGFTTMPTGYARAALLNAPWHDHPLILKGLRAPGKDGSAAPEYGLEPLRPPAPRDALQHAVIWDTPDIDSRYAKGRQHRVMEIIGLADVVVLVLSKEKYADHTAYELLGLLLDCGKTVLVCLNKFTAAEYAEGVEHFRQQMLDTPERRRVVGEPVRLAYVEPTALQRLWTEPDETAQSLCAVVAAHLRQPEALRQQTIWGAVRFVGTHLDRLLQPARRERALLREWQTQVEALQQVCMAFYRRHYLHDERRYDSFRLALLRLLELLDVPGINRVTRLIRQVVTAPMRWGWGLMKKVLSFPPPAAQRVEVAVLQESLQNGMNTLHTFLLERQDDHPVWRQLRERFDATVPDLLDGLTPRLKAHEQALQQAIETAAHQIYQRLQAAPAQLQALRGGKLALEVAVTVAAIKSSGLAPDDLVYGSLAYAGLQSVVQILGERYVQSIKRELQETQAAAVSDLLQHAVVTPLLGLLGASPGEAVAPLSDTELQRLEASGRSLTQQWRR